MKLLFAFVRKEFFHIVRDVRTMTILLGIPMVQLLLFGFAISTEVKNARIAVCDPSRDVVTTAITDRLNASSYFDVVEIVRSPDESERLFREQKIRMMVVFQDDFQQVYQGGQPGAAQIQLVADASDPNEATQLTQYAEAIIGAYQQEQAMESVGVVSLNQSGDEETLRASPGMGGIPLGAELRLLYNPRMDSAYYFVPGVLGMIMMLICAMMTAVSIVREKETGTMEVLLVSPVKPLLIILAKAIPYFALSCVNLAVVLLLSVFVLGVPLAGSLFWLVLVSFLFIFVSLSLGLLVSTLTNSQMVALLISGMMFLMPVVFFSGMMFPHENMPEVLRWFSNIIPAKWFIVAVKNLMIKGVGIGAVLPEVLVLSLMASVFVAVSMKKFKDRLE